MPFSLSKVVNFPQKTLEHISQEIYNHEPLEDVLLLGGLLSDMKHVWHAKGPCIEVKHIATGKKVGAWTFGCILKDSNTKIVCVDEVKRLYGRLPLLAVGINCTISGGLICIFDAFGSKVIRAIQIGEQITSLHVIDSGCSTSYNTAGPLKYFDGVIAVGCQGGNVFLVDICRQICDDALQNVDLTEVRDELCPCQLRILTKNHLPKLQKYSAKSVKEGQHLALHLNAILNGTTSEHFILKGEKGEDRLHVNQSEVEISSLYYASQLSSLFIGYNFGAFQMWHLPSLQLTYTSPVCDDHLSVTHFAIQEPADDPKAYCYVWVSYSNMFLYQDGVPYAVMYSLYFDKKHMMPGQGQVYDDFQHCSLRFQIELGPLHDSKNASKVKGGYCLSLQSISKSPIIKDLHSLALCLISWTLWIDEKETETFVLLFDLNQWYKEQMPNEFNWKNCSNYSISHAIKGSVLDVKLDKKSINQFIGVQRLEEHFCPTSLSFDIWGLYENSIHRLHNQSLQQSLLSQIEIAGPLCLVRPGDMFEQIVSLGLTPLFNDGSLKMPIALDSQRKLILDVVLEQKLIGFLCRCASEWANGSFSSAGLNLEVLIAWAVQRAALLKENCDIYCIPLLDYSGSSLDNNTIMLLSNCITQIKNICCIYNFIFTKLHDFIYDRDVVNSEYVCLQSLCMYFEMMLWLVNVGLLPEYHPTLRPEVSSTVAPYLVDDLTEYYNEKRAHLKQLSRETFVELDSLLFIDNLINKRCGGHLLQQQWQEDGGSGLYPPPSLQSMLRSYLIAGPYDIHKHSLVTYVLLDIAITLDENKYADTIALLCKFPHIFQISQSNIKMLQGFWHLDHGNFEVGLENILDPCVQADDIEEWHHQVVLRSLLLQKQYTSALLYMQIRKPPIKDEKDVLTVISLFVSKNLLDEAFLFEYQHRKCNEGILLKHLFNECNKNGLLHGVLYRCLTNSEEQNFFKYLEFTQNPNSEDLKVFYYLLRSRFIEAFDSHDIYKKHKPESQGLIGQSRATPSDGIVKMFKTLLPDVNRNLVDFIRKERGTLWKQVKRPTPLSVFVHNSNEQIEYKSTTIYAALAKAKQTFHDTLNTSHREIKTEETPFLRTPKPLRTGSQLRAPVIHSETIEINENGEYLLGPSPSKMLKLAPREATSSTRSSTNVSSRSILNTPIVKRKVSLDKSQAAVYTPHSILKSNKTPLQEQESAMKLFERSRKVSIGLSSRKSLPRTSMKTHVKFDDMQYSTSSASCSSRLDISSKEATIHNSSEDTFYSPNTSVNENEINSDTMQIDNSMQVDTEDKEVKSCEEVKEDTEINQMVEEPQEVTSNDIVIEKPNAQLQSAESSLLQSPRSRRSYKRSLGDSSPLRCSPRLARKNLEELSLSEDLDTTTSTSTSAISESLKLTPRPKIGGRKSLNRFVLEHNTFLKAKDTHFSEINNEEYTAEESKEANNEKESLVSDANTSLSSTVSVNDQTHEMLDELSSPLKTALNTSNVAVRKPIRGRQSITRSFTNSNKEEVISDFYSQHKQNTIQEEVSYSENVTHVSFTRIFEELRGSESVKLDDNFVNQEDITRTNTTENSTINQPDIEENLNSTKYQHEVLTSEHFEESTSGDQHYESNVLPQFQPPITFEDVPSEIENSSTPKTSASSLSSKDGVDEDSKAHKEFSIDLNMPDSDGHSSDSSDQDQSKLRANKNVPIFVAHKESSNELCVTNSNSDSSESSDQDEDEFEANKDIPMFDKAFISEHNQNDVIEIGSSSEDDERSHSETSASSSEEEYFEHKSQHSNLSGSESDHAELDGNLITAYENQEEKQEEKEEESIDNDESSDSNVSAIKIVFDTENCNFSEDTQENSNPIQDPVLDDEAIKEIYDFEDIHQEVSSSSSNVVEALVSLKGAEVATKITEEILESDSLTENVVEVKPQIVSEVEAMDIDNSEMDDSVFTDTYSGNSIAVLKETVVQIEESKSKAEVNNQQDISEVALSEYRDEELGMEDNDAAEQQENQEISAVELVANNSPQEIVEVKAPEYISEIERNEDGVQESGCKEGIVAEAYKIGVDEDVTTPRGKDKIINAILVDTEIQTTTKKSEKLEEIVEVDTEAKQEDISTIKEITTEDNTVYSQTPVLALTDAVKTYFRSRQKFTDTNDQVPTTPELVVNIVRKTYSKTDRLWMNNTEQSDKTVEINEKLLQPVEKKYTGISHNEETVETDIKLFHSGEGTDIETSHNNEDATLSPQLEIGQVGRTYIRHLTPQQLIVKKVKKTYVKRSIDPQASVSTENPDVEELDKNSTRKEITIEHSCDVVSSSSDVKMSTSTSFEPKPLNRNLVDTTEVHDVDVSKSTCTTSSKQFSTSSTSVDSPLQRVTRRCSLSKANEVPSETTFENISASENLPKIGGGGKRKSKSKTSSVGDLLENDRNSAKNLRSTRSKSVDPRELAILDSTVNKTVVGEQRSMCKEGGDKTSSVITECSSSLTSVVKEKRESKRTRSASVDLNDRREIVILPRCSLEEIRTDDSNITRSGKRGRPRSMSLRAASVSQLPAIDETEEDKRTGTVKNNDAGETYTSSRRLTRRQASMLKNVEDNLTLTVDDSVLVQPDVDDIDPIKLLDKSPFKGKPDPEEQKIYEQSSPSNSTVSSRPARRKSRSVSVASDSSLPLSVHQISTPTKGRRKPALSTGSSTSLGLRSRQKRKSSVDDEKSIASDISESPSPAKRTRSQEKSVEQEEKACGKSTSRLTGGRRRAASISSMKSSNSVASNTSATRRVTRKNSKSTELPYISEEKSSETTDSSDKSVTGRQTRSRKKL